MTKNNFVIKIKDNFALHLFTKMGILLYTVLRQIKTLNLNKYEMIGFEGIG
jgi:hypothetical protein